MTTRRDFVIAGTALAAAAAARSSGAASTHFNEQDYHRTFVIDGLGGVDDPYSSQDATVLDPRAAADLKTSGLTMSHITVNAVGNGADVWERTIVNIARIDQQMTDNPGVLIKASTTADIRYSPRQARTQVRHSVRHSGHQPRGCRSRSACTTEGVRGP